MLADVKHSKSPDYFVKCPITRKWIVQQVLSGFHGYLDEGDTIQQAASREAFEEISLDQSAMYGDVPLFGRVSQDYTTK